MVLDNLAATGVGDGTSPVNEVLCECGLTHSSR